MTSSVLKVVVGSVIYYADDPKVADGLKATISAVVEETTDHGVVPRILHRDRITLDRAKDRTRFAEAAGTDPAELNTVRDRILDFLAPSAASTTEAEPEADEATRQAALALLDAQDLLTRVEEVLRNLGYAGSTWLPLLIFLTLVSRLLSRPINLVISGPSAAGKSFPVMLVARLFPTSATYALNGMSERVLAYTEASLEHRTLIIQEAASLHRDGVGAALLRSVAWEGEVAYETVEKTATGMRARRIEKPGPTGFVTTTTGRVEPELETRVLTVTVPDDEATTRTILLASAARANGDLPDAPNLAPWHELQRWLAEAGDRSVTISFAERLAAAYRADQVRSRRDFTQLLALIQAHALLFQRQRPRDARDRIMADERDYRAIYRLAGPIFGAIAAEGVTATVRATVAAVAALVPSAHATPVTVNQVAARLGVHKSVASRRVTAAVKDGWLVNEEERKGRPLKLRLGDPLPEDRPALPDPDELFADPPHNRATAQPHPNLADRDTEIDGCAAGCAEIAHRSGDAPADAAVAEQLRGAAQPSMWEAGAESDAAGASGCSVALEDHHVAMNAVDGPRHGAVCVECDAPLPPAWRDLYCLAHGGQGLSSESEIQMSASNGEEADLDTARSLGNGLSAAWEEVVF